MSLARIRELADTHGPPIYELASETEPDGDAFMLLAVWRRTAPRLWAGPNPPSQKSPRRRPAATTPTCAAS